jgi:hypothetical protein
MQLDPCTNKLLSSGVYLALAADTAAKTIMKYKIAFNQCPEIMASIKNLEQELSEFSNAGSEILKEIHQTEMI